MNHLERNVVCLQGEGVEGATVLALLCLLGSGVEDKLRAVA